MTSGRAWAPMGVTYRWNGSRTCSKTPLRPYTPRTPESISRPAPSRASRYSRYGASRASREAAKAISRLPVRQQHRRVVGHDAVVVHHQGRPEGVPEMPAEPVLRVVSIPGDTADEQRA